ncbi:MAG: sulfatase [Ignavibacteriales bacterium]|nr:sulfatase [Ignavibacteriales bacterium]
MKTGLRFSIAGALLPEAVQSTLAEDSQDTASSSNAKNVLFMMIEDLRDSVLGCYGSPVVRTPNIDRLARKSVLFKKAYCQFPVCNPSRSSLLTGLRPDTIGILDNVKALFHENPDVVTLPAVFKDSGYYTARVGKVFHGTGEHDDPKAWAEKFDFDDNEIAKKGTGRNMTNGSVEWCRWLAAEGHDSDHSDGKNTLKAVELLGRKRDQNFFIAVGFHKPHDPFIAPKQYFDMYPLDEIVPPTVPGNIEEDSGVRIGSGWKRNFDEFSESDKKEFLRAYYACTTFVDAQIGHVLDAMDGLNLWKDTVVIVMADHGYNLGEHNWWNKNVLYDHSCRVPLMVYAPGETAEGKTCHSIVESLDVFPTITDICGLTSAKNLEGVSFRPLICDPAQEGKTGAYTQVQRGRIQGHSVRTKRWRYTEWDEGRAGKELYDHNNDPDEYYNLVNKAGLEGVIRQHQELLHADKK